MSRLREVLRFVCNHPLNRSDRIGAIGRLLRWQLATRLSPGPIAFPFVADTRLLAAAGMTGATGNFYCGLHEPGEMGFVLHALRPEELFVDVGANVGSYAILAAGAVGARVIAIEPISSTYASLERNVAINLLGGRVRTMQCGLAACPGERRFTDDADTVNHVIAADDGQAGVRVPVTTLDEVCADESPAVIKINVEGFEHEVVAGGQKTLRSPGLLAVIMETNGSGARYGREDAELVSEMNGLGFATASYDPMTRRLNAAVPGAMNTIFVRDLDSMSRRVGAAPRFALVNGSV